MIKQYWTQIKLDYYSLPSDLKEKVLENTIGHLQYKLSLCGGHTKTIAFCKQCEQAQPHLNHTIKRIKARYFCENRYCKNFDCIIYRFKSTIEALKRHDFHKGLKFLDHLYISFPSIPLADFQNNYKIRQKSYERVLNSFFSKLRKRGFELKGIRVKDFAFTKPDEVTPHYHFAIVPIGKERVSKLYKAYQDVRKEILSRQKIKIPFHLESPRKGLTPVMSILSYFAIRAIGLYKYDMVNNPNYKHTKGRLIKALNAEKYLFLQDILTPEQFMLNFYHTQSIQTFGKIKSLRHGSNITELMIQNSIFKCPIHGELQRSEVRFEIEIVGPPDLRVFEEKPQELLEIEYKRIN